MRYQATIALKLLRTPDARGVHAFKQEFRGLTHVVHENLAQLYELFADGDQWYFTMELVRGAKFTQYVRDTRSDAESCDPDRWRSLLVELLSAVRAIHAAGKLHCDLKPPNALVTETGRVVVLDFGLLTSQAPALDAGRPAMMFHLRRAHGALLMNVTAKDPALARVVTTAASTLERLRRPDACASADGIRSAFAYQRGEPDQARLYMSRALATLEPRGVPVAAHSYRLQLGRICPVTRVCA